MRSTGRVVVGVALLAVVFALVHHWRNPRVAPVAVAPPEAEAPATPRVAAAAVPVQPKQKIRVAFRLDPDVTRGHFLGERWVSPPTFEFAQPGRQYTTHAKLQTVGEDGTKTDVTGDWSTDAPRMIAISHDAVGQVTIVVREAGEGQLVASAAGQRKILKVRATRTDDAMEVAFAQ